MRPILKDVDFVIANLESSMSNEKKQPFLTSGGKVERSFAKVVLYAEKEALSALR